MLIKMHGVVVVEGVVDASNVCGGADYSDSYEGDPDAFGAA
jgi:hypothetical protein